MLTFGIICALVATTSAGYSSSSAGGSAGLYTDNYNSGYGSKYPYTNNYVGYSSAGAAPYVPVVTPFDIQHLWYQNLAQQAAIQNSVAANYNAIRDQALYGNRFGYGGYGAGGGGYAGSGGFAGAGVGSYGGVGGGSTYGGTYNSPGYATPVVNRFGGGGSYSGGGGNYAASGGSVGGGHQSGFAHVSPPRLDSRFGDEGIVSHSVGQPGVVGVSSFSSSSDINGYKQRESGTSVNNNGKVTTYYNRNK
ncbi:fibroin heavy chain isoform X4 [Chironomus tepperi]|uniref:fibroin heavy chain isoform X4 n=1 Tax=Chironomus tepperi TaxID=113505 RepID=UPI00391F22EF